VTPFDIIHTGLATASLGFVPYLNDCQENLQSKYALENLPLSPRLNAIAYSYIDMLQLEILAVNAFCNPSCALHEAENGFFFTLPEMRRAILREIQNVVCALPESQHMSKPRSKFTLDRLDATIDGIIKRILHTTCSMVWGLRAGHKTEFAFTNGYWMKSGTELGVPTPVNGELVEKVELRRDHIRVCLFVRWLRNFGRGMLNIACILTISRR
jgi:2-dehydropantoate 2-reductase